MISLAFPMCKKAFLGCISLIPGFHGQSISGVPESICWVTDYYLGARDQFLGTSTGDAEVGLSPDDL